MNVTRDFSRDFVLRSVADEMVPCRAENVRNEDGDLRPFITL